ncbi:MAG: ribonuclease P protein component [Nitrospiraceae bacterium]
MIRPLGDRRFFLRNSAEIERVKKIGRRLQTPLFNLLACPAATTASGLPAQDLRHSRVGIVVGKRLGQAVARNRAKRIFRELARLVQPQLTPARDILIFPRREILTTPHAQVREAWLAALRREGLLVSTEDRSCDDSRLA